MLIRVLLKVLILFHFTLGDLAAREDPFYFNAGSYDLKGFNYISTGAGAPPIILGPLLWVNSLAYREASLSWNYLGRELNPSSFTYGSFFRVSLDSKWTSITSLRVSSRNTSSGVDPRSKSFFFSGVLLFSRPLNAEKSWTGTFGLILRDKAAKLPILPALGLRFVSPSGLHEVNIQVPEPSYTYYLNQNFHFSAFARYENDIFLLPDDLIRINENNLYLRTTIILAGASASARIWNGLWGKLQVGRTLKTRTTILDRSFGTQSELGRPQGTFLQGGLSWRFQ